jgi:hypothetical protein
MYKSRDITNFKTATTALDLLTSNNDFNKFKTTLANITKLIDKKTDKPNIKRIIKQDKKEVIVKEVVQQTEKVALKPHVKFIKNAKHCFLKNETIMPSYEIIINRNYNDFSKVWNECKRLLYINSRVYMEKQQKPVKLRIGVEFTIVKHKRADEIDIDFLNEEGYYDEDDEEHAPKKEKTINSDIIYGIDMLYKNETNYIYLKLNASTTNISVYTPETMKEIVLSLETELIKKMEDVMNKVKGSGWAIYRYNKMYSILHTINTPRAGSYIKTPENMIIQNVD